MLRALATLALLFTLLTSGVRAAEIVAPTASPWPVVATDLPPDPALRQGTLANGVRYMILPNAEPKDHVSLRLLVGVGSLHEQDDERGLAHFVEHMAFRGTREFPAGSMTTALQRLGIAIGPDNTAFTSFDYTIYHLELPDTREPTLREGLRAFREIASGVTFDPALIDREREVVLSEMGTRDTPLARAGDAHLQFLWPRSREVRRKPIGTTEAIRSFTRAQFTAFYDAWYRPERLAVFVVGDIDPVFMERTLREFFAPLVARAPAREEPPDLVVRDPEPAAVAVFSDPGLIGFALRLERPTPHPLAADNHERRVRDLRQTLAFAMFRARLQRFAKQNPASLVAPIAQLTGNLRERRVATVAVNGHIADWQKVVADLEQEHRRAMQFGFSLRELEEARASFSTAYEQGARSASTRASTRIIQQLLGVVLYGHSFATPAVREQDLAHDLVATTSEDCLSAFRSAWGSGPWSVFVAAHPEFKITREQIASALDASRKLPVEPLAESAAVEFGYRDLDVPGKLVREEHLVDLDVRLAEFGNGVRFNFKSTTFQSDMVEIYVRVGEGKLSQPLDRPGLDLLANALVPAGGLGLHPAEEISRLMAGRALGLRFDVLPNACMFSVRCARRDVTFALQLVAAFLRDAAYRPIAMRDVRATFYTMFSQLAASPGGAVGLFALRDLAGGDRRFGVPHADELFSRDIDELKNWIEPQLKTGRMELSVVGDVSWQEASSAVARTLGALPPRDREPAFAPDQTKPPSAPDQGKLLAIDASVKQGAIAWYWPVTFRDVREMRRCSVLARVLRERFRQQLREELGVSYATSGSLVEMPGFPHLGHFTVYAEMDPSRIAQATQIFIREARALAEHGPTEDEFIRAKEPYLRDMTDNLRTNVYWGRTVLSDAQQHPHRLAAVRDRAADILAISRAELTALASAHLDPRRAFKYATKPSDVRTLAPGPPQNSKKPAAPPQSDQAPRRPRRRGPRVRRGTGPRQREIAGPQAPAFQSG